MSAAAWQLKLTNSEEPVTGPTTLLSTRYAIFRLTSKKISHPKRPSCVIFTTSFPGSLPSSPLRPPGETKYQFSCCVSVWYVVDKTKLVCVIDKQFPVFSSLLFFSYPPSLTPWLGFTVQLYVEVRRWRAQRPVCSDFAAAGLSPRNSRQLRKRHSSQQSGPAVPGGNFAAKCPVQRETVFHRGYSNRWHARVRRRWIAVQREPGGTAQGPVHRVSRLLFHPQEWSIPNFPCSLARNITSHSMENWAFIAYSDERWLYYQFSLPHFYISLL